jgi:hypothetical protein
MAEGCLKPYFHADCALELDSDAAPDNDTWMCADCEDRDAVLCDVNDDEADDLVTSTLLPTSLHAELLARAHVSVADVPDVLGLPRALSLHSSADLTQAVLGVIVKNVSRYWRRSRGVRDVFLKIVNERVAAGLGRKMEQISANGTLSQFRACFIDQPMRDALYTLPELGDDVSAGDDSWHLVGRISNMNMYATLSPVAAAGGATMPTSIMVYMAGSGVAGDKADAISFAHAYLHTVRMELYDQRAKAHHEYQSGARRAGAAASARPTLPPPPPQPPHPPLPLSSVRLFDKDASSFTSHFNDCKKLAGLDEAAVAYASVVELLQALTVNVTADEISAGKLVFDALPGADASGLPRPADLVPPKPSVLKQQFPEVGRRRWVDQRKQFEKIFNADVVDIYGPFMRGIARVALLALQSGVDAVGTSSSSGDLNVAAGQLLPVYFLFARNSSAADMLRRYYMHVVLLCDFHAWQAIERKLACVDRDLRSAVKDALREVFADAAGSSGPAWTAFKQRFSELGSVRVALDTTETDGSIHVSCGPGATESVAQAAGGKRMNFFQYVEVYWLSQRWWTAISVRFRAMFQRAGLNTTNDVELFW